MSKKVVTIFAITTTVFVFALNSFSQTKIERVQAKLFYQNTGTFSEDVFAQPGDLWNVYLDYVYSIFVTVEATGKSDGQQFDKPQRIEFSARYKPFEGTEKEILVRKVLPIWFDENGKATIGFWVDNVGCEPLKLAVKIKGQAKVLRKTINFGCGE